MEKVKKPVITVVELVRKKEKDALLVTEEGIKNVLLATEKVTKIKPLLSYNQQQLTPI